MRIEPPGLAGDDGLRFTAADRILNLIHGASTSNFSARFGFGAPFGPEPTTALFPIPSGVEFETNLTLGFDISEDVDAGGEVSWDESASFDLQYLPEPSGTLMFGTGAVTLGALAASRR